MPDSDAEYQSAEEGDSEEEKQPPVEEMRDIPDEEEPSADEPTPAEPEQDEQPESDAGEESDHQPVPELADMGNIPNEDGVVEDDPAEPDNTEKDSVAAPADAETDSAAATPFNVVVNVEQKMGDLDLDWAFKNVDLSFQASQDNGEEGFMKLEVEVSCTDSAHEGDIVGLVQNVTLSNRVATYANGGTLTTDPLPEGTSFPVLDGDSQTIPWYNGSTAKGQKLEVTITLSMKDGPGYNIPKQAKGPDGPVDFEKVGVEEHFTIYLYNQTAGLTIRQWEWSYAYKVDSQETVTGVSSVPPTAAAVSGTPVLEGPVAGGDNTAHRWTGGLSHEFW